MTGLSVRGLTVRRQSRLVVQDASFAAPAGAVTALLGLAGSGKTSLLAAIGGLLPVERGAVFVDAIDVGRLSARRRPVAFLAPGSLLAETKPAQAGLRRLAGRGNGALVDEAISALLSAEVYRNQPAVLLSHGEAFLALTAARTARPGAILLIDEAAAGLDPGGRDSLWQALRARAARGDSVVLATRDAPTALQADHLVLLEGGQILQSGTPAELYAEPRDAACARLTGAANILEGKVRELRAGGFVWNGGGRFLQATTADMVRPALGSPVSVCLRPERICALEPGARADNDIEGAIIESRAAGAVLQLQVQTTAGVMSVTLPSWPARAASATIRLGWAADAAHVLVPA